MQYKTINEQAAGLEFYFGHIDRLQRRPEQFLCQRFTGGEFAANGRPLAVTVKDEKTYLGLGETHIGIVVGEYY